MVEKVGEEKGFEGPFLRYTAENSPGYLTDEQFAADIGTEKEMVSRWFSGFSEPQRKSLVKISKHIFRHFSQEEYETKETDFLSSVTFFRLHKKGKRSIDESPPDLARKFLVSLRLLPAVGVEPEHTSTKPLEEQPAQMGLNADLIGVLADAVSRHSIATVKPSADWKYGDTLPPSWTSRSISNESYQSKRPEFLRIKSLLINKDRRSISLIAAVRGGGGYGKTSLAEELCDDREIRTSCPGGIYWLQFGLIGDDDERRNRFISVEDAINVMLRDQYGSTIAKIGPATFNELAEALPEQPLLIIADDIWNSTAAHWINSLPENASCLVTTRVQSIADRCSEIVKIERLDEEAAYNVLCHGIPEITDIQEVQLRGLCMGFRGWPLLLSLANGVFRQSRKSGVPIERVAEGYAEFLASGNITGWDVVGVDNGDAQDKRRRLVSYSIKAGLDALEHKGERQALMALCVFPNDMEIPFSEAVALWAQLTKDLPAVERVAESKALILLQCFADCAFFAEFDAVSKTFRFHDEVLRAFRDLQTPIRSRQLNRLMVDAVRSRCEKHQLDSLNPTHRFAWLHILDFLEAAGDGEQVDALRLDISWLQGRLAATDISGLRSAFQGNEISEKATVVGRAIDRSTHAVRQSPREFPLQIFGRIGHIVEDTSLSKLAHDARSSVRNELGCKTPDMADTGSVSDLSIRGTRNPDVRLVPRWPHLDRPSRQMRVLLDYETRPSHLRGITSVAFSSDDMRAFTTSNDGTSRIWSAQTGEPISETLPGRMVAGSISLENRFITVADDGTVHFWDTQTGDASEQEFDGSSNPITCMAFSPDGTKAVAGSSDIAWRVWNAQTGESIGLTKKFKDELVCSVAFDYAATHVAAACGGGLIRIWNVEAREPVRDFSYPSEVFEEIIGFSRDGSRIILKNFTGEFIILDAYSGKIIDTALNSSKLIGGNRWDRSVSVVLSPDGTQLLVTYNSGIASLWDLETLEPTGSPLIGHESVVWNAAFDREGKRIVTVSDDQTVRLWEARTGSPLDLPLEGHEDGIRKVAFNKDGTLLLTGSDDGTARIWELSSNVPVTRTSKGSADLLFHRNGRRIGHDDGPSWTAQTGEPIGSEPYGSGREIQAVAFNLDCSRIAVAYSGGTLQSWDALSGEPIDLAIQREDLGFLGGWPNSWLGWKVGDSDGFFLKSAAEELLVLLNSSYKENIGAFFTLDTKNSTIDAEIQTSAWVVKALHGGLIQISEDETGEQVVKPLRGHLIGASCIAFDHKRMRIATGSRDRTARLWDMKTGEQMASLMFDSQVTAVDLRSNCMCVGLANGQLVALDQILF